MMGCMPLVWSEFSSRLLSCRFILSTVVIASGLNCFALAGRNFLSKVSAKRSFIACKPASSSNGGRTPAA